MGALNAIYFVPILMMTDTRRKGLLAFTCKSVFYFFRVFVNMFLAQRDTKIHKGHNEFGLSPFFRAMRFQVQFFNCFRFFFILCLFRFCL